MTRPDPIRVIFDRSAFHGDRFELLKTSALKALTSSDKIAIFLTPVFLNETLTAYGSKRPVEWRHHLSFVLDICNGGIFLENDEIWREELVMGRGSFARHLLPEKPSRQYDCRSRLMARLREVANTGDLLQEWIDSKQERDEGFLKSCKQKDISREIRKEVLKKSGSSPSKTDLKNYPFTSFRKTEFERTGRHLMSLVSPDHQANLADQWARAPERFPFYSAFVDGYLYNGYYAALEHNERLDRNAQADYEQLAYLNWVDIVVSNDTKFFARAFDTLWKARGKRLETTESFVKLLQQLA